MAAQHGRHTKITVGGDDISPHCNTSSYEATRTVHPNTGYGKNAVTKNSGLKDGKFTCGGDYDTDVTTGPRAVLKPLYESGELVEVVRMPEGAGTGKPTDTFQAIVAKYVETNPVDGNVTWSADLEISGEVTTTVQV